MEPMQPVVVPAVQHNFEAKVDAKILPVDMKTARVSARIFAVASVAATSAAVYSGFWLIAAPEIVLGALAVSSVAAGVLTITAIYKYVQVYRNISARNEAVKELLDHFNPSEAQKHLNSKLITQAEFESLLYKDVSALTPERYREQIAKYNGFVFTNDVLKAFAQNKWEVYFESDDALEESLSNIVSYADHFQSEQMERLKREFVEKQVARHKDNYMMLRLRCPGDEALRMIVDLSKNKYLYPALEWNLKDAFAAMSIRNQREYAADKGSIGVDDDFLASKALVSYQQLTMTDILSDNELRRDFFEKVVKFDWVHAFTEKSLEWLSQQTDLLAACFAFPEFFQTKILTLETPLANGQKLGDLIEAQLQFQKATEFFETRVGQGLAINLLNKNSPALQRLAITYLASHNELLWGENLAIDCLPEQLKQLLNQVKTTLATETRLASSAKTNCNEQLQLSLGRLSDSMNLQTLTVAFERIQREQQHAKTKLAEAQRIATDSEKTISELRTLSEEIRLDLPAKRLELSVSERIRGTARAKATSLQGEIDLIEAQLRAVRAEIVRLTPAPTPREIEFESLRPEWLTLKMNAIRRNFRITEIKDRLAFDKQHPGKAQGAAMAWKMMQGETPEKLREELANLKADNARLKELEANRADILFPIMSPELKQKKDEEHKLESTLNDLSRQKEAVQAEITRAENDLRRLKTIVEHLANEQRTLPERLHHADAQLSQAKAILTAAQTNLFQAQSRFTTAEAQLASAKASYEQAAQPIRYAHTRQINEIDRQYAERCKLLKQEFTYKLQLASLF